MHDKAAGALWNLSAGSQQGTDAIVAAGAVPLLAASLGSKEPSLQASSAAALNNLSARSQQCIISGGAVPLLVSSLKSDQPAVRERAASTLKNVAATSPSERFCNHCSRRCSSACYFVGASQPAVQEEAAAALRNLASGSQQSNHTIIAAGAAPLLVALLRSSQPGV